MVIKNRHFVHQRPLEPPFPVPIETALFGLGCFWGAERVFWSMEGVYSTAVGYAGGYTPHPSYEQVCGGDTGHNEVVFIAYQPDKIDYTSLLKCFWEAHDPTQGMRQGHDIGSQYRSSIYYYNSLQQDQAEQGKRHYQSRLLAAGYGQICTEILAFSHFYYAEDHHQQYLARHPTGYCGLGGTGVAYAD